MPAGLTIRERPSLRLNCSVKTPGGPTARWGFDDPNPIFAPKDLTFDTTMPGGFSSATLTLERKPERFYADSELASLLTVLGNGGSVAWQGRLEKSPDSGGFQAQETIESFGLQAALEDDNTAREIYVDRELSRWEDISLARKIALLEASIDTEAPTVGASSEAGAPAVETSLTGAWSRNRLSEAWYDAKGIPLAALYWAWKSGATVGESAAWNWAAGMSETELAAVTDFAAGTSVGHPAGSTESGETVATAVNRVWAFVQEHYLEGGGTAGVTYPYYWTVLAVYGRHGLPRYGTNSLTEAKGLLASDIVGHAVSTWAPELAQVIVPSTFVIEQLALLEATTAAEIIKQATRFELPDWAVWEGPTSPTFYMNPQGERGRQWRARVGPAQLQGAGPQISRLWNGVAVQYQDYSGAVRMVGPPGFAGGVAGTEDPLLLDLDPLNPFNQLGRRKWALLKMGTAGPEAAKRVGREFLREQATLELSGQATIVGHVEDLQGNYWPAWAIRSGDSVSFVDAAITAPRRIVNTSYSDSARSNTLQLEQPPDTLQAILERLSVALVPLGLS